MIMEISSTVSVLIAAVLAVAVVITILILLRRVVPPNEVHIVQSGDSAVSYSRESELGASYYAWPAWVPRLGVVIVKLPMSVFGVELRGYEGYDVGRVPFVLDIKAFFRIEESNLASERVASFDELKSQLTAILQGSVRSILASEDIENILQGRSEFGHKFTLEVNEQLMDIRDTDDSSVISDIMAKKISMIDRDSRIMVAENNRAAKEAEIAAEQEIELRQQNATLAVGVREAQVLQEVGIAKERASQEVKVQAKATAEREADVRRVQILQAADIEKHRLVTDAEGEARRTVIDAEAAFQQTEFKSRGIQLEGEAHAAAERAAQLAPVQAQIELAKEIGANDGYQSYLVRIEQVKAGKEIGVANAEALKDAAIKVIVTGGTAQEGISSIGDLISPVGGVKLGAMVESMKNTSETVSKMLDATTELGQTMLRKEDVPAVYDALAEEKENRKKRNGSIKPPGWTEP
jgi:flotillin